MPAIRALDFVERVAIRTAPRVARVPKISGARAL
jgi:hypothetical protein